jgi:amidohydrolase
MAHDDLRADLDRLEPDLVALRRDLHRHPELGFEERRTSEVLAERLRRLGLEVTTGVGRTGIVADLRGDRPGPTLLFRADMDALPVEERSTRDYASANRGVMHACGHDAHMAALYGAAVLLAERRPSLGGRIRFALQPAEEVVGGAAEMIAAGVLDGVDRAVAAHVLSPAPFGVVVTAKGPFFAGVDMFELKVIGKAGHGAMPEACVDPIYAAAQVVTALQSIVARETRPGERVVVSVTSIEGGRAVNVVVDEVTLRGTVRWHSLAERERVLERVRAIATGVCGALRARAELRVLGGAPITVNDAASVDVVSAAVDATGRAGVIDVGPLTVSEDFSLFLEKVPGCLIGVGCGGADAPPHHHHSFDLDERAIALTAEIFARTALTALR